MSNTPADPLLSRRFGRRELLAIGAASGVAAMLTGVAGANPDPRGSADGIGYILGSETSSGPGSGASGLGSLPLVVAPARAVPADASLAGATLDITVHGLFPGLPESGFRSVALDALFASFTKHERGPFPFAAWSFAAGSPARSSSKILFKMPVDSAGGVSFAVRTSDSGGARTVPAVLSLRDRGAARLRPGVYLLGLPGTEFANETVIDPLGEPDWSLLSLVLSVQRGA